MLKMKELINEEDEMVVMKLCRFVKEQLWKKAKFITNNNVLDRALKKCGLETVNAMGGAAKYQQLAQSRKVFTVLCLQNYWSKWVNEPMRPPDGAPPPPRLQAYLGQPPPQLLLDQKTSMA
jgi:hypothetical protein